MFNFFRKNHSDFDNENALLKYGDCGKFSMFLNKEEE